MMKALSSFPFMAEGIEALVCDFPQVALPWT